MIVRTLVLLALLITLAAQPATAQTPETLTCTVTQSVVNPDGTKTSSVRLSSNCVLLPIVAGG